MDADCIYTRVYSSSSVGGLVSGHGQQSAPLSEEQLLKEFERHSQLYNREHTALVSVSSRIIDTVKRAFELFRVQHVISEEIWVLFIAVPDSFKTLLHSAQTLAKQLNRREHRKFQYEFLVEGQIRTEWVLHRVSLKTLMSRGLDWTKYWDTRNQTTEDIRLEMAKRLDLSKVMRIAMDLCSFARHFGARAPVNWIAHQLFYDCLRPRVNDDGMVLLQICSSTDQRVESCNSYVEVEFFIELENEITYFLVDLWLTDDEFLRTQEDFCEWEADESDSVWRELESLENDPDVYERAYEILWSRYHRMVEKQAVRIGL